MPKPEQLCAQLAARALVDARRPRDLGCMAEDLPPFDAAVLVEHLSTAVNGPFRFALLGYKRPPDVRRRGVQVTNSETVANTWRNERDVARVGPLFVVVQGTDLKLKSIRSAMTVITDRDLRRLLAVEAISWSDTPARRSFWAHLTRNSDDFSVGALLQFAAVASEVVRRGNHADLAASEAQHLHLLNLLPERDFWNTAGEKKIAKALSDNAGLTERIRQLTRNDRRTVARVAEEGRDDLSRTAEMILSYHRSKRVDALRELEYSEVVKVLRPKKPARGKDTGEVTKPRPMKPDEAGLRDAIETGGKNLEDIVDGIDIGGDPDPEDDGKPIKPVEIDGAPVVPKPMNGTAQATSLCQRLTTEDLFGGVVRAPDAHDAVGCIKTLEAGEASVLEFRPLHRGDRAATIQSILERAVAVFDMPKTVVDTWQQYVAARHDLLPLRDRLVACPLVTLLIPEAHAKAERVVRTYAALMDTVQLVRETISRESPQAAQQLLAGALALDVIMLQYRGGRVALAGPLHPFHLWRYTQIATIARDHRQDLKKLTDEQLRQFTEPVVASPHLVVSHFVDHSLEKAAVFIAAGSLGYLPLYSDPDGRVASQLRAAGLVRIVEKFLRASPHASLGFEAAFIDPPSLADVLDAVLSVNRRRSRDEVVPVHVRVFRTRASPSTTEEDEDDLEELAEALRDCRGSLDVDPEPQPVGNIAPRLEARKAHYTVFFEPGNASSFRVGTDSVPRRSPLLLPRHYRYDRMEDQFTVHVSGDGEAFGEYHALLCDHLQMPRDSAIGRRSGAQAWKAEIARIGANTMWFSVVDQDVEPTFTLEGAVCLGRDLVGDRDLLTFTSYTEILDRSLQHLIEQAGLAPTDATRARTHRMFRRLGGNLLSDVVGRAAPEQSVGLLGVLAVVEWHERHSSDALLVTMDSPVAQAWILGAVEGDNRRGDMLCLRQTNGGVRLDVVEVKTWEAESAALRIEGSRVTGRAVEQVDNTIRALKQIFASTPDVLDCTRREILRDQFYQAVASQELTRHQRTRVVAMLEEFFREGPREIGGRVFLVHLEPGVGYIDERVGRGDERSPQGNAVEAFRIRTGEADAFEVIAGRSEFAAGEEAPRGAAPRGGSFDGGSGPATPAAPSGSQGTLASPPRIATPAAEQPTDDDASTDELPEEVRVPKAAERDADGVSVFLGEDNLGNKVTWDTTMNPAFGMLVTGDTGFGKTQTLRAVIADVREAQLPVLIFDYKPDYADEEFCSIHGLTVYDVKRKGLPFNPLALVPDRNGDAHPIDQIYDFAEILKRVLGLGDQQENRIVEAQIAAYEKFGWDPKKYVKFDARKKVPAFSDVIGELEALKKDNVAKTVYTRLRKFEDLGLFPATTTDVAFERLMGDSVVLLMNELPQELANTLSEVMIVRLHGALRRGEQPRKLRRLLVFDEAWRVSGSKKLIELAREGRAFGVGLAIGTQNPVDMPDELVSCLRTQLFLFNKDPENQKAIARAVCGQTSGREASRITDTVKRFEPFQAYIVSEQYKDGHRVNVHPYKDRTYKSPRKSA
jgi:hypothetical protein